LRSQPGRRHVRCTRALGVSLTSEISWSVGQAYRPQITGLIRSPKSLSHFLTVPRRKKNKMPAATAVPDRRANLRSARHQQQQKKLAFYRLGQQANTCIIRQDLRNL